VRSRPRITRPPLQAAAAAALAAVCAALAGCGGASTTASGTAAEAAGSQRFEGAALPSIPAPPLGLRDAQGREVHLAGAGVTVLAFLYSNCTACTLIAQQIRGALDELPSPPRVLIVSADPGADTPAHVRAFLARVGLAGRARWLTGSPAQLARVWRAYRVPAPAAGRARFEGATPVVLIDGSGRERVIYQQEQLTPEALAHDIRVLQQESGPRGASGTG
jgi:cytochrome oxidase Cu insertion factor (SCO1/SenC/PrrC family)